jgi:hypothetical protein
MRRIELGNQTETRRELPFVRVAQHRAVRTHDERKVVGLRRQPFEQRDGFGVLLRIERQARKHVAPQEVLQCEQTRIAGRADEHDAVPAFDHEHAPQNQRAHDLLAEIGFADHHCAEFVGSKQDRFDVFDHMRVDDGGLVGELRHVRRKFAALRIRVDDPLVTEAVAADDADLARQHDEHARTKMSRAIKQLAFRVTAQIAEAAHTVYLRIREHGKHLLVTRMIAHARVFGERAVVDGAALVRCMSMLGRSVFRRGLVAHREFSSGG